MIAISKIVDAWFASANEDLNAAIALWEIAPMKFLRVISFHCQQAAEKSIKGYLAFKKIKFTKTHDIGSLASLVTNSSPLLESALNEASHLSPYAIDSRYPEPVQKHLSLAEVELALETAKRTLSLMETFIS